MMLKTGQRSLYYVQRRLLSTAVGGYKAILRPWKGRELNQKALDEVMMVNSIWPKEFPFPEECFDKLDTSPDGEFYDIPKLDMHISKETAECVKGEYNRILPKEAQAHLELGAGVLSYFPDSYKPVKVTGYGMNMEEVNLNKALTERKVKDLNISPILEEESDSYDCVTLAFSVQYLTKPHLVLAEAYRILNSGGLLLISFTDRCFETKVTDLWYRSTMLQRSMLCRGYMHYGGSSSSSSSSSWGTVGASALQLDGDEPLVVMWARKP